MNHDTQNDFYLLTHDSFWVKLLPLWRFDQVFLNAISAFQSFKIDYLITMRTTIMFRFYLFVFVLSCHYKISFVFIRKWSIFEKFNFSLNLWKVYCLPYFLYQSYEINQNNSVLILMDPKIQGVGFWSASSLSRLSSTLLPSNRLMF